MCKICCQKYNCIKTAYFLFQHRLEKEAEKKIIMLADRAHHEAVVQEIAASFFFLIASLTSLPVFFVLILFSTPFSLGLLSSTFLVYSPSLFLSLCVPTPFPSTLFVAAQCGEKNLGFEVTLWFSTCILTNCKKIS